MNVSVYVRVDVPDWMHVPCACLPCATFYSLMQLALSISSFNVRIALSFLVSILTWFVFVVGYSFAYSATGLSGVRDFAHEGINLLGSSWFWLAVPCCGLAPLLLDIVQSHGRRFWWPTLVDIVQEWDR